MKPAELPDTRRIKTTTSSTVPLTVPLPRPRPHSPGPPIILPSPDYTIESHGKKKQFTLKSTKMTPKSPQKPTSKPVRKRKALE